jgi:MoxR-like ATPase
VYADELIVRWIVELVSASRQLDSVALGASVRASLALERMSRAWALLHGREYVTPRDVERLFLPVLGHRVIFTPTFLADERALGRDAVLQRFWEACLERAPRPEPDEAAETPTFGRARGTG